MKKYIFTAIAAIFALTSCSKDFLNKAPLTAQSDELTLSTIDGIDNAVGGVYSPLASSSWYGAEFVICNEMKTMNGRKAKTKDSGRLIEDYQINYSPSSTYSGLWAYAYYTIAQANVIIDKIDATPSLGDAQTLANYKAECLFLRALSHFDLVITFAQPYGYTADASHAGVPVVLHQDVSAKPARNTVAEVYDQIIKDLETAESIIDATYTRDGTDAKASVSIWAIKALMSRVYLYKGDYQKSCDKATEVINSGKFAMWTADEVYTSEGSTYSTVYAEDAPAGGEVIFEVYGNKSNSYDGYHDGISPMTTPSGYGDAAASNDLYSIYEDGDIRKKLFIIGTDDNQGDIWTMKYVGKTGTDPDYNNTIVIRLSEMYLNRAEALCKGAVCAETSTTKDLETITANRNAKLSGSSVTNVYEEREKELAWEGHLWFDLARTGRAMKRTDVDKGVITTVEYPSYMWAMPIPDREISANPNLVQNEGYNKE